MCTFKAINALLIIPVYSKIIKEEKGADQNAEVYKRQKNNYNYQL